MPVRPPLSKILAAHRCPPPNSWCVIKADTAVSTTLLDKSWACQTPCNRDKSCATGSSQAKYNSNNSRRDRVGRVDKMSLWNSDVVVSNKDDDGGTSVAPTAPLRPTMRYVCSMLRPEAKARMAVAAPAKLVNRVTSIVVWYGRYGTTIDGMEDGDERRAKKINKK